MWQFDNEKPIYLQIMDKIIIMIVNNEYLPGDKLASVRDFAKEIQVNPNTLQKAFYELEQRDIIITQRTSGRYVTDDLEVLASLRKTLAYKYLEDFKGQMQGIGYSEQQIKDFFNKEEL